MVGIGFRRIALAQGLLDGPADRNSPVRSTDRDDRAQIRSALTQDGPRWDIAADNRVLVGD